MQSIHAGRVLRLTAGAAIVLGVILRLFHYLSGRSLWFDEAQLALNLFNRSPTGLLGSLDHSQLAPFGFLLLTKAAVGIFGSSELVLRLVPLLASLASLPLFMWLTTRLIPRRSWPVAWILFAVAHLLIYYAAEFKPYGLDVLAVLALTALALEGDLLRRRDLALTLAGGALVPWFSFAGLFVLPMAGAMLAWRSRYWPRVMLLGAVWSVSALAVYYLNILPGKTAGLLGYWQFAYPASYSVSDIFSWLALVPHFLPPPLIAVSPVLLVGVALIGALRMAGMGRHLALAVILAPVALGLLLAFTGRYPMVERLALFSLPAFIWLVAAAFSWNRYSTALGLGVCAAATAMTFIWMPPRNQELRPVLELVADRARPDDTIYMYSGAVPAARYYAPRLGLEFSAGVSAPGCHDCYIEDINRLPDGRVWVTYSHARRNEVRWIISHLDSTRTRIDSIGAPGAGSVLYR